MQGISFNSNKSGGFHEWVSQNKYEILDTLYDLARDLIQNSTEKDYDNNLILDGRFHYLSNKNKKESYIGQEKESDNGIPYITVTYKTFKHGGHSECLVNYNECKDAIRNLWHARKNSFYIDKDHKKLEVIKKRKKDQQRVFEENKKLLEIELKKILDKDIKLWDSLANEGQSEYLTRKKLNSLEGIRFGKDFIAVRIINTEGVCFGLQKIYNNGFKQFTKGLKKTGHFSLIGSKSLSNDVQQIHISEGISTAGSIYKAINEPVVAALDASNIEPVIQNLRKRYPRTKIIIWADNDQWKADQLDKFGNKIGNTGLIHANHAALLRHNVFVVYPDFKDIFEKAKELGLTDFNDLHVHQGLSAFDKIIAHKPDINIALTKKAIKVERLYHGLLSAKQFENAEKTNIDSKYITDFELSDGINLIRSPIGSGKTQIVEEYIKSNKDKRVLFATHLVSLIEDAAARLELKSYNECCPFDLQIQKRIAICLNSLGKLTLEGDLPNYDVLVIDEIEQVLNRLTSNIDQKPLIFGILKKLIQNTKTVVCLDAHLSDKTISIFKKWCSDRKINILFNEYKIGQGRDIVLYDSKEELQVKVIHQLEKSKSSYITLNSKNEARKTFNLIKNTLPSKKGLYISGDNNGDKEVRAFFNNVNEESKKYDYIVCTPSISTGVSISNNHFDFVAGIFNSDINTPNDCMQAIGRVRESKQIHVHIERRINNLPIDVETISKKWNETHKYDLNLMGISDLGKRVVICPDYEMLRVKTTQHKNRGLNNFFYQFCLLNSVDGYNISYSDFKLNKEEISNLKEIKNYYTKTKQIDDIINAQHIDNVMAKIIDKKSRKEEKETLSFEKHKLVEFYNLDKYNDKEITEFVNIDQNGKKRQQIKNLELALSDKKYAKELFEKQLEQGEKYINDLNHYALKQELYQRLLKELKLIDEQGKFELNTINYDFTYNKEYLQNSNFIEWVKQNHSILRSLLNIRSIDKIINNPISFVSNLLGSLGLKQDRTGRNENGKYYVLSEEVQIMISLLNKRNFFKGDTCCLNVVNRTGSVPSTAVPTVLNNLISVAGAYAHYLNKQILDTKNKFTNKYIVSMPIPINI